MQEFKEDYSSPFFPTESPPIPTNTRNPPTFHSFEEWKEIIHDWRESQKPLSVYCRENGLGKTAFRRWKEIVLKAEQEGGQYEERAQHKKVTNQTLETFEKWKRIIEDWKKSGLSKGEYCRNHNLPKSTFSTWCAKLSDPVLAQKVYERIKSPYMQTLTPEEWQSHIENWKRSGLSINAYCTQEDISPKILTAKLRKLNVRSPLSSPTSKGHSSLSQSTPLKSSFEEKFAPIKVTSGLVNKGSRSESKVEVHLDQGHRFYIQGPIDWDHLRLFLTTLLGTH